MCAGCAPETPTQKSHKRDRGSQSWDNRNSLRTRGRRYAHDIAIERLQTETTRAVGVPPRYVIRRVFECRVAVAEPEMNDSTLLHEPAMNAFARRAMNLRFWGGRLELCKHVLPFQI